MKNELGITKGEWMILDTGEFESTIYANQIRIADVKSFGDGFNDAPFQERLENEKLIAEAGTVANETGKTPRQLADDNKLLLEALMAVKVADSESRIHTSIFSSKLSKQIDDAIKQVTE